MPNLCFNWLTVSGPAEEVVRFQQQAVGFWPWGPPESGEAPNVLNFHSLVPIPPEVLAAGYKAAGQTWEFEHWSCHVGARHAAVVDQWEGGLVYQFLTDWTPAVRFVEEVSRAWVALVFVLSYQEPRAAFEGLASAHAGTLEDHCVEL